MELLNGDIFERSSGENGVVVRGSSVQLFIKNKVQAILLNQQASGDAVKLVPEHPIKK